MEKAEDNLLDSEIKNKRRKRTRGGVTKELMTKKGEGVRSGKKGGRTKKKEQTHQH